MKKEVWLRGEVVPGVSPYLQPAAHALLQAQEEINAFMADFPEALLWKSTAGEATPGFHLKHIAGVQDRLMTYAENKPLTEAQLAYLQNEKEADSFLEDLLFILNTSFATTIDRMRQFRDEDMTEFRGVGRQQLPSTVAGLCFHTAEHTMRHTGQLLVTVKVLKSNL